jgi:hypothetical protein
MTGYTDPMTETQTTTTAPNGNTVTTHPHPTWNVRSYRAPKALVSKVIAIAPGGKSAVHRDKVTDADLAATIATMTGDAKRVAIPVDVMAVMGAQIDAAKDAA